MNSPLFSGIILASQSPRRKDLLNKMGISFEIIPSELVEMPPMGDTANSYAARMALEKAVKVGQLNPNQLIIGADTVVALGDLILGKPKSSGNAIMMLSQLSGQWHDVWTGICVYQFQHSIQYVKAVRSQVRFRNLTPEEIEDYAASGEPMDKAGSYAIQGKGKNLIREVKGSYHNIIGLPTMELGKILQELGIPIDSSSVEAAG